MSSAGPHRPERLTSAGPSRAGGRSAWLHRRRRLLDAEGLPRLVLDVVRRVGSRRWAVVLVGRVLSPLQRLLYQWTGGRLSLTGRAHVLLLTVVGRRTGLERTVPLFHLRDGDRLVVCNVNPGFERTNPWVLSLRATPHARVQVGGEVFRVDSREATPEEVERYWPSLTRLWPAYQRFSDRGGARTVFVLTPASSSS